MCVLCRSYPCVSGCPNAKEPEPEHECSGCGYGIFEGDRFLQIGTKYYCEQCLDNMTAETLLDMVGYELETA